MASRDLDVVIIDDEATVTDLFQKFIIWKYSDWRFLAFSNPEIIYNAIVSGQISAKVWVIDMMMPGKNGADVATAVREHQGDSPAVLAYTALEKRSLETQEAYRHGLKHFNQVINKREDFGSILALIEVLIAQRS